MKEKYEKLARMYYKMFGDAFPLFLVGYSRSDDEILQIMKECLKKKKSARELGYCSEDEVPEWVRK